MFGIKIISEEKYQSEQKLVQKLIEINEELTKKNVRLELDIKDLRKQNTKLRSINAKRRDEINSLVERLAKLKDTIKEHEAFRHAVKVSFPEIDFKGYHPVPCNKSCSKCALEQEECKKYTNLSVCMLKNEPSFRESKQ